MRVDVEYLDSFWRMCGHKREPNRINGVPLPLFPTAPPKKKEKKKTIKPADVVRSHEAHAQFKAGWMCARVCSRTNVRAAVNKHVGDSSGWGTTPAINHQHSGCETNMKLEYSHSRKVFFLQPSNMAHQHVPAVQQAGFEWVSEAGLWVTDNKFRALTLATTCPDCVSTPAQLGGLRSNIERSCAKTSDVEIGRPAGQNYLDFQRAGVDAAQQRYERRHKAVLLADPMGLGKSIMGCGTINHMFFNPERTLIVCPAALRLNWQRELKAWLTWPSIPYPVLSGHAYKRPTGPYIVSYELLLNDRWFDFLTRKQLDFALFDESQYMKNPEAARTLRCLARGGILDRATCVMMLSGTPIPNYAHELYPILKSAAPDTIDCMSQRMYETRYTSGFPGDHGWVTTGGRNHEELGCRLRGSGFMVRRDKRAVLPQLPQERHAMVVFPQDKGTATVVRKEQDNTHFTADEILNAGQPLGYGAIPELRHEMGIEKIPVCLDWIRMQMDGGQDKMVVFAYHHDVLNGLYEGLSKYNPLLVYGKTNPVQKQRNIDMFQMGTKNRIIIGGWKPLGTGWTLTAADCVVFVEASFVPGDNLQCVDRIVRYDVVYRHHKVTVYYLVVQGSVESTVLAKAAKKLNDSNRVLN